MNSSMKQTLAGKLTIVRSSESDVIHLHIHDDQARTTFLSLQVRPADLMLALTGRPGVECLLQPKNLERVGKNLQSKIVHVQIPDAYLAALAHKDEKGEGLAKNLMAEHERDGWRGCLSDMFSRSRRVENGAQAVSFTRWVEPVEPEVQA